MHNQPCLLSNSLSRILKLTALAATMLAAYAVAQNPVPQIVGPVHPMAVAPGSGAFSLSVFGANFVPGAVVNWNYQPRTTTYISGHELQAQILATDVAKNTAGYISVTNPAPGGGSSSASWAQVEVHAPISTINLKQPQAYAVAYSITADFTHSGILSLLGEYNYWLVFDKGLGNGTFRPSSQAGRFWLPLSQFSYGDFNGDGNLDAVTVQGSFITPPDHMQVWLGDGKGKFSSGPTTTAFGTFGLTAVGDFNQDGKLDLFTSGRNQAMFLGNGDGTFQHLANYPLVNLATQMVAGDFNGDGKLDVVFLQLQGGIVLSFLAGNGNGTFQTMQQIYTSPGSNGCSGVGVAGNLQVSDFNGDGKLDLAFCNNVGQVGVMLGNGDGTFQAPIMTNTNAGSLFAYSIGDINCDGKPDLLVGTFVGANPQILVFSGNGDGTFQQTQAINSVSPEQGGLTLGDFNRDGLLDIVVDNAFGQYVYLQQ